MGGGTGPRCWFATPRRTTKGEPRLPLRDQVVGAVAGGYFSLKLALIFESSIMVTVAV